LLLKVGPTGFEPIYTVPKTVVLPLDDGPIKAAKINILLSFARPEQYSKNLKD
jgi:hypothetical protein